MAKSKVHQIDSPDRWTLKKEKAAQAHVYKGMNYSDSWRDAYESENMTPKSINECASRLFSSVKMVARIDELHEEAQAATRITVQRQLNKLDKIHEYGIAEEAIYRGEDDDEISLRQANPSSAVAAIAEQNRILGFHAATKHKIDQEITTKTLTPSQYAIEKGVQDDLDGLVAKAAELGDPYKAVDFIAAERAKKYIEMNEADVVDVPEEDIWGD